MVWRGYRCRPAGNVLTYNRRACWSTRHSRLNRSLLGDLSALVQLHCTSWMFNGSVAVLGLPAQVLLHDRQKHISFRQSGQEKQWVPHEQGHQTQHLTCKHPAWCRGIGRGGARKTGHYTHKCTESFAFISRVEPLYACIKLSRTHTGKCTKIAHLGAL